MHMTNYTNYKWIAFFVTAAIVLLGTTVAFADSYGSNGWNNDGGWNSGKEEGRNIDIQVTGSQEVPSVNTSTTGRYWAQFNENGASMTHRIDVFSGDEITGVHLHCAAPGSNGPVVVNVFSDPNGTDVNGQLGGGAIYDGNIADADCMSKIGYNIDTVRDLARAINDGKIYVNVHSQSHPDGLIRGNLPAGQADSGNGSGGGWNGGHHDDDEHGWKDDDHDGKSDWYKDHDGNWKDSCNDWNDDNHDGKHDWNNKGWDHWNKDHGNKDWNDNDDWNHDQNDSWKDDHKDDWKKNDNHDWNNNSGNYGWKNQNGKDGRDGKDGKNGDDDKDGKNWNRNDNNDWDKNGKNDNRDWKKSDSHKNTSQVISNVKAKLGLRIGH